MEIVNTHLNFSKAVLIPPNTKGYIHIAAEVDLSPVPFFWFTSKTKMETIRRAQQLLSKIENQPGVDAISLFKAAIIPPARQSYLDSIKEKIHVAKFDLAILIETSNVDFAVQLREHPIILQLVEHLEKTASFTHVAVLKNARRIAEVDKSTKGIFLFNYFYAQDPNELLPVWEYTAGWFTANTGLDNSTLLMPVDAENSSYGVINHCRWDKLSTILPSLIFKKTLRSYVVANFEANMIAAMPILYRLVTHYESNGNLDPS